MTAIPPGINSLAHLDIEKYFQVLFIKNPIYFDYNTPLIYATEEAKIATIVYKTLITNLMLKVFLITQSGILLTEISGIFTNQT